MRSLIFVLTLFFINLSVSYTQNEEQSITNKKHGVVWSAGLFKSWLTDNQVKFNKIGDNISPVFIEQKKMGVAIQSHYMYKPSNWFGVGAHLGIGLDVYSNIEAPVVLLGASFSIGKKQEVIIDFGWADGKRKIVPQALKDKLLEEPITEIPVIYDLTELNTNYYFALSYRIFYKRKKGF